MPLSTVLGAQSLIKPGVCTTATRPASPYDGQMIYDTTVSQALVWNGTAFVALSSAPTSRIRLHTHNGYGSSSTMIPRFATTVVNSGSDITYADSATLGSTFTINTAGMYAIGYWHGGATSGSVFCGISLNSAQLSTAIYNITASNRLVLSFDTSPSGGTTVLFAGSTFYFAVGDVIRPHTNAETPGVAAHVGFSIARVN